MSRRQRFAVNAVKLSDVAREYPLKLRLAKTRSLLSQHILGPGPDRITVGEIARPQQPAPVHQRSLIQNLDFAQLVTMIHYRYIVSTVANK